MGSSASASAGSEPVPAPLPVSLASSSSEPCGASTGAVELAPLAGPPIPGALETTLAAVSAHDGRPPGTAGLPSSKSSG